jgi:adenine-specific DNA-methyltransferase
MLKLYGAEPVTGFRYIHGKKGIRLVHVGSLNAPVSMEEVRNTIKECVDNKITKLDVLGWEWSYEVNDLGKQLAKEHKIDLRLIQIPSVNEIKSALVGFDLKLLKMPEQVIDEKILKNIRFSEVSYLEVEHKAKGKKVTIKITDFQVPPSNWLDEIKDSIKKYSDLIDYWAVDWDYQGDTFHNQWQAYRTKKERKIELEATKTYDKAGEYQIMVKVVDVFGNDTNKIVKVKVK